MLKNGASTPVKTITISVVDDRSESDPVPYLAANGIARNCFDYEIVTDKTATFEDGKWYVVPAGASIVRDRVIVNGSAHLILCDGGSLTAQAATSGAGVQVETGSALTIYGQTANTGKLIAVGGASSAGIGGVHNIACGTVTINGGDVTATGGGEAEPVSAAVRMAMAAL